MFVKTKLSRKVKKSWKKYFNLRSPVQTLALISLINLYKLGYLNKQDIAKYNFKGLRINEFSRSSTNGIKADKLISIDVKLI